MASCSQASPSFSASFTVSGYSSEVRGEAIRACTNVYEFSFYSGTFDSPEWKEYVSQPSLPYVLKLLTGLCKQHGKTQVRDSPIQLVP